MIGKKILLTEKEISLHVHSGIENDSGLATSPWLEGRIEDFDVHKCLKF